MTQQNKASRGRPKVAKEKAKGTFMSARVSEEEAGEIKAAIEASGKKKSRWVRDSLLEAARKKGTVAPENSQTPRVPPP